MRSRGIKPGFFENEDLAECTPMARLCFIGLWLLADREGRLEDRPKRIKGQLFCHEAVDVNSLLFELNQKRFILRYVVAELRLIQVIGFTKHQNPHKQEKPSQLPPPTDTLCDELRRTEEEASPIDNGTSSEQYPNNIRTTSEQHPKLHGSRPADSLIPDSGFLIPDSKDSVPVGTAAVAAELPMSAKDRVWLLGVALLGDKGRPFLGRLVSTYGEGVVVDALSDAGREQPGEPKSWLTAACDARAVAGRSMRNPLRVQDFPSSKKRRSAVERQVEIMDALTGRGTIENEPSEQLEFIQATTPARIVR